MNQWCEPRGRRKVLREIEAAIVQRTSTTPVEGFTEVIEAGDAKANSNRIASFYETHEHCEWILPLSAQKGLIWKTAVVPDTTQSHVLFTMAVGFGVGSPLPQPSGQWDVFVNDHLAVSLRTVSHCQLWRNEHCSLVFLANRIENAEPYHGMTLSSLITNESCAAFGPAFLKVPTGWLTCGQPAVIRVEPRCPVPSTRWFQLVSPAANMLQIVDFYRALDMLSDDPHPTAGKYHVYFGDIHAHSGQVDSQPDDDTAGCGSGTRQDNYEYARGPGGLDFFALTDHEWQIDPDRIDDYLAMADRHNEADRFVCLGAFEYTNLLYGHRNVYFRDTGGTVFNTDTEWGTPTLDAARCNTPDDLWAALKKTGVPFITAPHHPSASSHPLNLDFYHPEYDRLYEIYSCWGSSEYYGDFPRGVSDRYHSGHFRDALRRGQRYGVIAASDGHDGHPGNAQSPLVKHHHLFHFLGSGRTAVLCERLTRHDVFDALSARRCYATTGVPIVLDVRVNNMLMGEEMPRLQAGRKPLLQVNCQGTNGIDHIRIIKNARVAATVACHGQFSCELEWRDEAYNSEEPSSYYVRVVQKDRQSAWSSPIWIG